MADLIMPTRGEDHLLRALESLHHIPFGIRFHLISAGDDWPEAVNIGLKDSCMDVILMDDDVVLWKSTFDGFFQKYYNMADIFGFKLLYPTGEIQHAGAFVRNGTIGHIGWKCEDDGHFDEPYYVCHVTTSLVYIKRHVIEEIGGMAEDYPGMSFEDVDFSFRALKAGFKILYVPQPAYHLESATKKKMPDFERKMLEARKELDKRHLDDPAFARMVESYPEEIKQI